MFIHSHIQKSISVAEQDMCRPNPCRNFGSCSEVEHDYECTCTKGFIGKNCDSKYTDSREKNVACGLCTNLIRFASLQCN